MPTGLDSVIAAGMAKEPRDRYPSTVDLARAAKEAITAPIRHPWAAQNAHPQRPAPQTVQGFHTQQAPWRPAPPTNHGPWQPPLPPYPGSAAPGRPWWRHPAALVSALAAVVVIALVAVFATVGSGDDAPQATGTSSSSTTTTTTTTTPPPPPPPNIDTLMLDTPGINTIMGATGMTVIKGGTGLLEDEETISPPECRGIALIISKVEFAKTPVVDTRWQTLSEPGSAATHSLIQNVVRVESPSAARAYFDNEARAWQACEGKQILDTNKQSGQQFTFTYVGFVQTPDVITMSSNLGGLACQRALGVRGNYLADVSACGKSVTNQGETVVKDILDRTNA